jgi:hypothetical protein
MISLAIVGSRSFTNYALLADRLDELRDEWRDQGVEVMRIVSGGAQGADKLAERYARDNDLPLVIKAPNWHPEGKFDRGAGKKRNTEIVAEADRVVAFWDGSSPGTRDTITKARKAGKWIKIINTNEKIKK